MLKKKDSEDYEVWEEVFDKPTLMTMYNLFNHGVITEIFGAIKSGKESKLYLGKGADDADIAIKIYLTASAEFRRGMLPYVVGDPRFKVVRKGSRALIYLWARKEFKNLQKALDAGVRVPRPIQVEKNVLVMEFIGENGLPAPTLKEVPPSNPEQTYQTVLRYVKLLYQKANLVHSDLSEYNIMSINAEPVIFDVGQAVHIEHPNAREYLLRDLQTLTRFFKQQGIPVETAEDLYDWVTRDD
ncbi:MAG: serine protein kinase RIO [Candidatus Bathyarchaeota archaeon]|nr:MAG: serine protein kinase RIO [Candidatus Bathyarchaeota archaeon]